MCLYASLSIYQLLNLSFSLLGGLPLYGCWYVPDMLLARLLLKLGLRRLARQHRGEACLGLVLAWLAVSSWLGAPPGVLAWLSLRRYVERRLDGAGGHAVLGLG